MTQSPRVFNLDADADGDTGLREAAAAVREGQCIVLPTDTVYGIGADAFDADAVQRLLNAKERGRDMPPPVLVAEPSMLRAVADEVPEGAAALAKAFWPGALTLILRAQPRSGMQLGDTGGTVAVRVPDHEGARALLRHTGPLAVSSANVHGRPAAVTTQEAVDQLGDRVAVYLDAGPAAGGVASTIVDFASSPEGRVLREGALSLAQLHEFAPQVVGLPTEPEPEPDPEPELEPESAPEPEPESDVSAEGEPEEPGH